MSDTPVTDDLNILESLHTDEKKRNLLASRYRKEDLAELAYVLDFDIGCLIGCLDTAQLYLESGLVHKAHEVLKTANENFTIQRQSRRRYWKLE